MKEIRRLSFEVLALMGDPTGKNRPNDTKNNNLLKELKCSAMWCLGKMSEVTGMPLGRRRNLQREDLRQYENIAFDLAHRYAEFLQVEDRTEIFSELVCAGMEGLAQGLAGYDPMKKTKISTFLYSRAKFAIQKTFAQIKRQLQRSGVSLNNHLDDEDDDTEFQQMVMSSHDTAEAAEKNVMRDALTAVMGRLPERQRRIVAMCADSKPSEVAKKIGMPPSEMKNLMMNVQHLIESMVCQWAQGSRQVA